MACQICEGYSGFYPLCSKCFKKRDAGELTKCPNCGKWTYTDKPCIHCFNELREETAATVDETIDIIESDEVHSSKKCLTCDNEHEKDYLFCKSCFYKYKNKQLILKVVKCSDIEILDDSYEGVYECIDGHVVKSKTEREIDNYLFNKGIQHVYETRLAVYDDEGNRHLLRPDFYLPEQDLYIEHWGYDESNKKYQEIKKFKLSLYEKEKITLICTNEKEDTKNLYAALNEKLKHYRKGEINFNN